MEAARERAKKRMADAMLEPEPPNNAKSQNLGSTSSNPPAPKPSNAAPAVAVASGASASAGPPATSSHTPPAVAAPIFLCDDDMVKHILASNLDKLKALAADLQITNGDSMPAHLLKGAIVRICGSADSFEFDSDTKDFAIQNFVQQHFAQPTAASGQSA